MIDNKNVIPLNRIFFFHQLVSAHSKFLGSCPHSSNSVLLLESLVLLDGINNLLFFWF